MGEQNMIVKFNSIVIFLILGCFSPAKVFAKPGSDSGCVASCGQGWEKNGDHCYFWSTAKKNWNDAEAFCKKEGGHLASVNSNVTNNFIVEGMREWEIIEEK